MPQLNNLFAPPTKEELRALQADSGIYAPPTKEEIESLKQEDEGPGILKRAGMYGLEKLGELGEAYNSRVAAPVRSGIMTGIQGGGVGDALSAVKEQYGKPSTTAPSGSDIITEGLLGGKRPAWFDTKLSDVAPILFSDDKDSWRPSPGGMLDPSAGGVVNFAAETALDPGTFIPVGKIAQGGIGAAKGLVGKAVKGADAIADAGLNLAGKAAKKTLPKAGEILGGGTKKEITTLLTKPDDVTKAAGLIKNIEGGDQVIADQLRQGITRSVQDQKGLLNAKLTEAFAKNPDELIDVTSVVDSLKAARDKMNKAYHAEDIKAINGMLDDMSKSVASYVEGDVVKYVDTPENVYTLKQRLQNTGASAYAQPGKFFSSTDPASKAFTEAGKKARLAIHKAVPEVADADRGLSTLRNVEKSIDKKLFTEGKPSGMIFSAGSGLNPKAARDLEKLGGLIGRDLKGEAEVLASARRYASPDFSPIDVTGKSVARQNIARGAGIVGGMVLGQGPLASVGIGEVTKMLASPAAFKAAIRTGQISADAIRKFVGGTGSLTNEMVEKAYKLAKDHQKALNSAIPAVKAAGAIRPPKEKE